MRFPNNTLMQRTFRLVEQLREEGQPLKLIPYILFGQSRAYLFSNIWEGFLSRALKFPQHATISFVTSNTYLCDLSVLFSIYY